MPSFFASTALLAAVSLSAVSAHITPAPTPTAAPIVKRQATTSPLPLTDYKYAYSAIPYQVNPYNFGRGPQSGYNLCNSTTEGASSQCQTLEFNSLSDFCLWGSPTAEGAIGNVEAAVVSYCTKPGHGARNIGAGFITAAQFVRTSAYIQVTGLFDQTSIGLLSNDTGGELDPHGADQLGNPLGGLFYSTDAGFAVNGSYGQVYNWNVFVGSGIFCMKACYNNITSPDYCENTFDIIGCSYNMPSSIYEAANNTFLSCDSDLQDEVGRYVVNGTTMTWSEPESLAPGTTLPWTPRIPASSNCVTYQSTALFATATSSGASTSTSSGAKATSTSGGATTRSGSSSVSATSTSSAPASTSKAGGASAIIAKSGLAVVAAGLMGLAVMA